MGFWYFLLLFLGSFLVVNGIFIKRTASKIKKIGFVIVGVFCISFSIFMFQPGSAERILTLLNSIN